MSSEGWTHTAAAAQTPLTVVARLQNLHTTLLLVWHDPSLGLELVAVGGPVLQADGAFVELRQATQRAHRVAHDRAEGGWGAGRQQGRNKTSAAAHRNADTNVTATHANSHTHPLGILVPQGNTESLTHSLISAGTGGHNLVVSMKAASSCVSDLMASAVGCTLALRLERTSLTHGASVAGNLENA